MILAFSTSPYCLQTSVEKCPIVTLNVCSDCSGMRLFRGGSDAVGWRVQGASRAYVAGNSAHGEFNASAQ